MNIYKLVVNMSRITLICLLFLILIGIFSKDQTESDKLNVSCYTKNQLDTIIDNRKFQTFTQSFYDNGKVLEIMITPLFNKEIITIEYVRGTSNYCITSITHGTTINEEWIEILYNTLQKIKGLKV